MSTSHEANGSSWLDRLSPERLKQSALVETDFESRSHPELERMIASANPEKAEELGGKLVRAAGTIEKIGNDLKDHAPRVDWQGDGADAFRAWSSRMSSATLRLGEMSRGAGEAMKHVAQTLREVKRDMPVFSQAANRTVGTYELLNPGGLARYDLRPPEVSTAGADQAAPTRAEAEVAQRRLADDHGEAVRQMRKLASAYTLTAVVVHQPEKATFPPMPREMMPPKPPKRKTASHIPLDSGSVASPGPTALGDHGWLQRSGSSVHASNGHPDGTSNVHIAGGAAVPDVRPGASPSNPSLLPSSSVQREGSEILLRDRPTAPGGPSAEYRESPVNEAVTQPASPVPRQPVSGPTALPLAKTALPQQDGGPNSRSPAHPRTGIFGGRPVIQPSEPPRGVPQGIVAGGEQTSAQRPPAGYRPGTPPGLGTAGPYQQRILGGSQHHWRQRGAVGGGKGFPDRQPSRPFTPGGTGLVRNPDMVNAVTNGGHAGRPSPRRSAAVHVSRQPHARIEPCLGVFVEGEESWSQRRRTVPPVID